MIEQLNTFSHQFFAYFLSGTVQNAIFLLCLFTVLFLVRKRDARLKKAIALIGLVKLCLPPIKFASSDGDTFNAVLYNVSHKQIIPLKDSIDGICSHEIILLIWASFVAWFTFAYILQSVRLRKLLNDAEIIDPGCVVSEAQNEKVRFLTSDKVHSPMVCGLWNKKIVLPENWNTWSDDFQKIVITHEMTHIKEKDLWTQMLQYAAITLNFYNPFVWLLNKKIHTYSEMVCDGEVINKLQIAKMVYMKSLIAVAEFAQRPSQNYLPSLAFSSSCKQLKKRIMYMHRSQYTGNISSVKKVMLALLFCMIIPISKYWEVPVQRFEIEIPISEYFGPLPVDRSLAIHDIASHGAGDKQGIEREYEERVTEMRFGKVPKTIVEFQK